MEEGKAVQLDPQKSQLRVGAELKVGALVKLGKVRPEDVSVELYFGSTDSWGNIINGKSAAMECRKQQGNTADGYWFDGVMLCENSGRQGLSVRIQPKHADMANPYELGLILWESSANKSGL